MTTNYENYFEYMESSGGRHHCLQKVDESKLQFFVRALNYAVSNTVKVCYDNEVYFVRLKKDELTVSQADGSVFRVSVPVKFGK